MVRIEDILGEIQENAQDTLDYLDIQAIILAAAGRRAIGFAYEANGPDRAPLLVARLKKEIEARSIPLLRTHRHIVQLMTSSLMPVKLKEMMGFQSLMVEYCQASMGWVNVAERYDESLGSSLRVLVVVWVESNGLNN